MIDEQDENLIKELRDKEFLKRELRLKEEEDKKIKNYDPNELCDFPF